MEKNKSLYTNLKIVEIYPKSVFPPINDDSRDLLIEKHEDCGQGSWAHCGWNNPPRIVWMKRIDNPSAARISWREFFWYLDGFNGLIELCYSAR